MMDSFGAGSNHAGTLARDTLVTSTVKQNRPRPDPARAAAATKDSFDISFKELDSILQTIRENNITDVTAVKDYITFKDTSKFNVNQLSDQQLSKVLDTIRLNIAEKVAEIIYATNKGEKYIEMTVKERAHLDNIISSITSSQVTNLGQAIEFVKQHADEHPGLFSKVSSRLIQLVYHKQIESPLNKVREDSFSSKVIDNSKQSNPFNSNTITTQSASGVAFPDQLITGKDRKAVSADPRLVSELTGIILSSYLKNSNNPMIPDEVVRAHMKQVSNIDQLMYHDQVLAKNVSYLSDIAAKVASEKARTIIICRIIGETAGAAAAALGMAAIAGACPFVSLLGAFAFTVAAGIIGMVLGKATGEEIGKLITNTNIQADEEEQSKDIEEYREKLQGIIEQKEQESRKEKEQSEKDSKEESAEKTEEAPEEAKSNHAFDYIDPEVSEALKYRILLGKK